MRLRRSLTTTILALAALNVVLIAVAALAVVQFQLGHDFDSFLLTTARERTLAVGRAFALDLNETEIEGREQLADRYAATYGMRVVLLSNDGVQLTGTARPVPDAVKAEIMAHPEGPELRARGGGPRRPPPADPLGLGPAGAMKEREPGLRLPRIPDAPPFLVDAKGADGPEEHWIGVRIPIRERGQEATLPGTLVFGSASLIGNPFYFQPLPWLSVIAITLVVTAACWLPFVRGITRSVAVMTTATEQIAEGQFDVVVPSSRGDELGALARAIQQMSGRLKALVSGQKRFLGDVAHELRSPLARINIATSLLERTDDPAAQRHVADVREDVDHMTGLTDDLLAFARAELATAPTKTRPVDVRELALRAVRLEAKGTNIDLECDSQLRVTADPDLLFRALSNLLRNAVQHAGTAGAIRLRAMRDGEHVLIVVSDEGPGVPEASLHALFTPFYRPEPSRDRLTGGVGLGLAIVRSAIEACGGGVSCRNREPRGFEVTVRLRPA